MLLCCKTIRLHQKVSPLDLDAEMKLSMKDQMLAELVLNEIVEILAPLTFIGSITIAYYGPNRDMIAIVGPDLWTHQQTESLGALVMPILEMAMLDTGSLFIAGLLLWKFCRINIAKECCKALEKYWLYLAFGGGTYTSAVSFPSL